MLIFVHTLTSDPQVQESRVDAAIDSKTDTAMAISRSSARGESSWYEAVFESKGMQHTGSSIDAKQHRQRSNKLNMYFVTSDPHQGKHSMSFKS